MDRERRGRLSADESASRDSGGQGLDAVIEPTFRVFDPDAATASPDSDQPKSSGVVIDYHPADPAHAASLAAERLVQDERLYRRNGGLVAWTPTTASLAPINAVLLHKYLSGQVIFRNQKGEPIRAPAEVLHLLLQDQDVPFRPVLAVVTSPTIRRDGSLLDTPGYDPTTELILDPTIELDPLPETPTREDAVAAWEHIRNDGFGDFPFQDEASRAVALTALLTMVGPAIFDGPAPMFGVSSNRRGSGKDLFCRVISTIAHGKAVDSSQLPASDSAMANCITAVARAGSREVCFSNVTRDLGGAAIEDAVTACSWTGRILRHSDMTPSLRLRPVWLATGNHLRTTGDFARRLLPIIFHTTEEQPETRSDFRHPDLLAYVARNRAVFLRDCLVILRAFHVAGCPSPPSSLGSFEAWSAAIAAAVHWVTEIDPIATRAVVFQEDAGEVFRRNVVTAWAELPGGTTTGTTIRDAIAHVASTPDLAWFMETLQAEFGSAAGHRFKTLIGNRFKKLDGSSVGGRMLTRAAHDSDRNAARWVVQPVR
jgi:hypothetical protein